MRLLRPAALAVVFFAGLLLLAGCLKDRLTLEGGSAASVSARAGLSRATVQWEPAGAYAVYLEIDGTPVSRTEATGTSTTLMGLAAVEHQVSIAPLTASGEGARSSLVRIRPIAAGNAGLGPVMTPAWVASGGDPAWRMGFPVTAAGDVNDDGFADVLVGAYQYSNPQVEEGAAFLFRGTATGLEATPAWQWESDQADAQGGKGISSPGDLDGDGLADVVVAATDYTEGQVGEGKAWVFFGNGATYDPAPWTWTSNQVNTYTGRNLGCAGDVNGDGFDDLALTVHSWSTTLADVGGVHVFHGSPAGIVGGPSFTTYGKQASGYLGMGESGNSGDANGDGFDDLLLGSYMYDAGGLNSGLVTVIPGSAAGLSTAGSWTYGGTQAQARLGYSAGWADVDGDGYDDVLAGEYLYSGPEADEGRVLLFRGSPAGLSASPDWTMQSDFAGAQAGEAVAGLGDINGDGFEDVGIGGAEYGGTGRVWIHLGGPAGLSQTPAWVLDGDRPGASFGGSLSGAGDVNGDGSADVLVGVRSFEGIPTLGSRAWLFLGPPNIGPAVAPSPAFSCDAGAATVPPMSFTSSVAGGALTCLWDFGDGTPAVTVPACTMTSAPAHVWATQGEYLVRLRITDELGTWGESLTPLRVR